MDFQKIQPSDVEAVVDLLDTAFPVSRAYIENDLREIQNQPKANGEIYGLWVDGERLSALQHTARCYGKTSSQPDGEAWDGEGLIRYLAVHPEHRRKGHATWIINTAIKALKSVGSPCVAVGVCVWAAGYRWRSKDMGRFWFPKI